METDPRSILVVEGGSKGLPSDRYYREASGYTTHSVPVIAGLKFIISPSTAAPYLSLDIGKYFVVGNKEERAASMGSWNAEKYDNGTIFKLGAGLQYHLNEHMFLDVSGKYLRETDFPEGIELMAGVGMQL